MGQAFPASPVAVHNKPQRTLIALVALVAVGLSIVAIVVSTDSNTTTEAPVSSRGPTAVQPADVQRSAPAPEYKGRFGTPAPSAPVPQSTGTYASPTPAIVTSDTPAQRYDGGPEEGSASVGQRSAPVEQTSGTYASPAPSQDHESDLLQDRTGFSR